MVRASVASITLGIAEFSLGVLVIGEMRSGIYRCLKLNLNLHLNVKFNLNLIYRCLACLGPPASAEAGSD